MSISTGCVRIMQLVLFKIGDDNFVAIIITHELGDSDEHHVGGPGRDGSLRVVVEVEHEHGQNHGDRRHRHGES